MADRDITIAMKARDDTGGAFAQVGAKLDGLKKDMKSFNDTASLLRGAGAVAAFSAVASGIESAAKKITEVQLEVAKGNLSASEATQEYAKAALFAFPVVGQFAKAGESLALAISGVAAEQEKYNQQLRDGQKNQQAQLAVARRVAQEEEKATERLLTAQQARELSLIADPQERGLAAAQMRLDKELALLSKAEQEAKLIVERGARERALAVIPIRLQALDQEFQNTKAALDEQQRERVESERKAQAAIADARREAQNREAEQRRAALTREAQQREQFLRESADIEVDITARRLEAEGKTLEAQALRIQARAAAEIDAINRRLGETPLDQDQVRAELERRIGLIRERTAEELRSARGSDPASVAGTSGNNPAILSRFGSTGGGPNPIVTAQKEQAKKVDTTNDLLKNAVDVLNQIRTASGMVAYTIGGR